MIKFIVAYMHPTSRTVTESMVYAVDANNFLIVDENGSFQWVPMQYCKLIGF